MNALHTKDAAARRLIQWHFTVEPELREVYRIVMDDEGSQEEPIRLLEVNAATVPTGSIEPFGFSPTEEISFRTVIAEITPDEGPAQRSDPGAVHTKSGAPGTVVHKTLPHPRWRHKTRVFSLPRRGAHHYEPGAHHSDPGAHHVPCRRRPPLRGSCDARRHRSVL